MPFSSLRRRTRVLREGEKRANICENPGEFDIPPDFVSNIVIISALIYMYIYFAYMFLRLYRQSELPKIRELFFYIPLPDIVIECNHIKVYNCTVIHTVNLIQLSIKLIFNLLFLRHKISRKCNIKNQICILLTFYNAKIVN